MGDSFALFLVAAAVAAVIFLVVMLALSRRRAPHGGEAVHEQSTYDRTDDGRPVHRDPDPERMAGGNARFVPPSRESPAARGERSSDA